MRYLGDLSFFFLSPGMLHLATDELCYGISLLHSSRTLAINDTCVSLYIISAPLFGCVFCNRYSIHALVKLFIICAIFFVLENPASRSRFDFSHPTNPTTSNSGNALANSDGDSTTTWTRTPSPSQLSPLTRPNRRGIIARKLIVMNQSIYGR